MLKSKIAEIIYGHFCGKGQDEVACGVADKILSLIRESLPAEDKHDSELLMAGSLYEAEKVGYNRYRSELLELLGGGK